MNELSIRVKGRVQGVGFRANIKQLADSLLIKGKVQNETDGTVTIIAQGKKKKLNEFIEKVKQSPGFSKVEEISHNFQETSLKYPNFEVFRTKMFISDKLASFVNLGKNLIRKGSGKTPIHVAIIPDGNRRWARERGEMPSFGHYNAGSDKHLKELFETAKKQGVRYFSIWGFSTENWDRNSVEIEAIFELVEEKLKVFIGKAHENKIRFRHLGRKDRLPKSLLATITKLENETKNYTELNVQILLDYGGRDELIRAINKLLKNKKKSITPKEFSLYLDTQDIPDPDLIIRTAGEKRTSGFMPFQSVYAELYFSDKYFPDFSAKDLDEAIHSFGKRIRRFGATAKEDLKK